MRKLLAASTLLLASLVTVATHADPPPTSFPVTVDVVGHGEILLIVADGSTKPCDSSDNRILVQKLVAAGDQIKLTSTTGSVCIDHTYGAFRRSEWAGPSMFSAGRTSVSTEVPN